jgi:hypothetical protein
LEHKSGEIFNQQSFALFVLVFLFRFLKVDKLLEFFPGLRLVLVEVVFNRVADEFVLELLRVTG